VYKRQPLVQGIIDIKTDQVVQDFYFDGPSKVKLQKWGDKVNLQHFLHRVCKQMLIYGNAYVEAIGKDKNLELKILNSEWMRVIRKQNGTIIGYVQKIAGKDQILWGTTGNKLRDVRFTKKLKLDSISHFKFNVIGSEKYGTSTLRSVLPSVQTKLDMEEDLSKVTKRYISPLIWAKVGNDDLPASEADITTVAQELEDIHSESEFTTSHLVELQVLGFQGKGIDINGPFKHVDSQIISGGQVPGFLLGRGEGVDRAVAEVGLRSFGRHIKSIQRTLKVEFEDQIIRKQGLGSEKDKLIWIQADEREMDMEIERIRGLVTDGILTAQKANDLLPPRFTEQLPEPEVLPDPRASQALGGDKIPASQNPNDPTKSTQMKDGKRVTRSEVKSPLDDKGSKKK
jgi:hypothetical protein